MEHAKVEITLSNITDITLINTKFPDDVKSFVSGTYDYRGVQEAYRQLKMAANKQSNKIDELRYESLEMDAYKADNSQKKSISERFILYTNAWSNQHGQDWLLALLWLGLTTRVSYLLIKFLLGWSIKFHLPHVDDFITYLEFAFNPLHEFKSIFGENNISPNIPWARLIDLISKSLSAYLLFQLVKAFRKYVKEA